MSVSFKEMLAEKGVKQIELANHLKKKRQYIHSLCGDKYYMRGDNLWGKTFARNGRMGDNLILENVSSILKSVIERR